MSNTIIEFFEQDDMIDKSNTITEFLAERLDQSIDSKSII